MKKYKLTKIKGYITEEDGIFLLIKQDGSKESCTKKEIEFYGGLAVVSEPVVELAEFGDMTIEDIPVKKKTTKKKTVKNKSSIKKILGF